MKQKISIPPWLPIEEAEGKIVRLAGMNDLRIFKIKGYFLILKEHTSSYFEPNGATPLLTGYVHKKKNPRISARISPTALGFNIPTIIFLVLLFLILYISGSRFQVPFYVILIVMAAIAAGVALLNYGFSAVQGGDTVLRNMKTFLQELQEEVEAPPFWAKKNSKT